MAALPEVCDEVRDITESEIQAFARTWYEKLDVHAPLHEFAGLLTEEGLEMVFPEGTVKGLDGFASWYERVIRLFFDEVHQIKKAKVGLRGAEADVEVVVHWAASRWTPPAAKSERIELDAFQTWTVRRDAETGNVVVSRYVVERIEYSEGSAKL
jgi:hypothetical protein